MLKRVMRRLHKKVMILMCMVLVVESLSCAGVVVNATVSDGDATVTGGNVTVTDGDSEQAVSLEEIYAKLQQADDFMDSASKDAKSAGKVYQYGAAKRKADLAQTEYNNAKVLIQEAAALYDTYAATQGVDEAMEAALAAADAKCENIKADVEAGYVSIRGKVIYVNFYVLRRGLDQPEEVTSNQSKDYSKAVQGILKSGEYIDGEYVDYASLYNPGIKLTSEDQEKYFKVKPADSRFGELQAEFILEENEYIEWYVIKTMSDCIHVDGIIKTRGTAEEEPQVTPEPTEAPVVTPEPTEAPVVTPEPTEAPVVTPEPTEAPVVTPEPTEAPLVTPEPTEAPVVTPEPTEAPVVTPEPTEAPVVTPQPTSAPSVTPQPEAPAPSENPVNTEDLGEVTEEAEQDEIEEVQPTATPNPTEADTPVEGEDVVNIEDGQVPQGEAPGEPSDVVEIEDEPVALAEGLANCWIHWMLLLMTVVYFIYEASRIIYKGKRIKMLQVKVGKLGE